MSSELWWLVGPGLILRPGTWEEALGVSSAPLPALSRKHCLWSCWNCQSHCSREPGPHPREEGRGGGGTLLELPVAGLSDLIAAKEAVTGQASRAGGSTQHVGPSGLRIGEWDWIFFDSEMLGGLSLKQKRITGLLDCVNRTRFPWSTVA